MTPLENADKLLATLDRLREERQPIPAANTAAIESALRLLAAEMAGMQIEHKAHAALLDITRRDRDEARQEVAALRAQVAELQSHGASLHKATAKGREMERADVLAGIGTLIEGYLSTHGGGGNYCLALEMARRHIEAGVYEGAAEKP